MSAVPFLQILPAGIYCAAGDFYLDAQEPVARAVITHAHADHAVSGHGEVFCTRPTAAFMQLRYGRTSAKKYSEKGFGDTFRLGEVKLSFIPAGHMLGSAQVLMQHGGITYLFTGDFKLQADPSCEPYTFARADVLITESTFAHPEFIHPDSETEIRKLNADDSNVLLGAYSLGKAQRLSALIAQYCPQRTVLLHHRIHPYHQLYAKMGGETGTCQLYNRKAMKNTRNQVYIVPPFTFESYRQAKEVKRIFATGWKARQAGNDAQLYISDHADWPDLLRMIGETAPREIWTHHGSGAALARHFAGQLRVTELKNLRLG